MLNILTAALCALIFVRLFTYRRDGARFRRWMSLLAVVVMACCGAAVIYISQGDLVVQLHAWPLVGLLAVLTAATFRCGGNLAAVMRGPESWNGRERRKPLQSK